MLMHLQNHYDGWFDAEWRPLHAYGPATRAPTAVETAAVNMHLVHAANLLASWRWNDMERYALETILAFGYDLLNRTSEATAAVQLRLANRVSPDATFALDMVRLVNYWRWGVMRTEARMEADMEADMEAADGGGGRRRRKDRAARAAAPNHSLRSERRLEAFFWPLCRQRGPEVCPFVSTWQMPHTFNPHTTLQPAQPVWTARRLPLASHLEKAYQAVRADLERIIDARAAFRLGSDQVIIADGDWDELCAARARARRPKDASCTHTASLRLALPVLLPPCVWRFLYDAASLRLAHPQRCLSACGSGASMLRAACSTTAPRVGTRSTAALPRARAGCSAVGPRSSADRRARGRSTARPRRSSARTRSRLCASRHGRASRGTVAPATSG